MKQLLLTTLLALGCLTSIAQVKASFSDGTLIVNGAHYNFALVEAGTFTMGATSEMEDPNDDELPAHKVTLTHNYYMCKTEVTQALWKAIMGSNPSHFNGDRKPVEQVSWNDCQIFIKKLNAATGKNFRLPTEAEWEFAARGGNKSRHYQYSGNNTFDHFVWNSLNSNNSTHDVGSKEPNELGIYDMSGNVMELCSDWHGSYSNNNQTDPTGPATGDERVSRGGSWNCSARFCRSSNRNYSYHPDGKSFILGFRLAITDNSSPVAKKPSNNHASYSNGMLTIGNVSYEMVKVDAGTFTMGATPEMKNPVEREKPAHKVTLTKDFYIGKTEVTQALWKAVTGKNPSWDEGDNKPVEGVSWGDCQEFIAKINAATGKNFRLPTEAEWEFAARGGNKSQHYQYSGSNFSNEVSWNDDNCGGKTQDVATRKANELGIHDMSGNVYEWCADWYGPYTSEHQQDPTGPASGTNRVSRGGSFRYGSWESRCSYRRDYRDGRYANQGFRLALSE